jgi:hypothetical protein
MYGERQKGRKDGRKNLKGETDGKTWHEEGKIKRGAEKNVTDNVT